MEFLFIVLAYVIGAIPFSYLFGKKFKNTDLRKHGSGNLGTTNAFRVLGKTIGIFVLILDITKSGLLVLIIKHNPSILGVEMLHPLYYGLASVVGHIFPLWMKFKGGKGVASSFGLLIAYAPFVGIGLLPFFLLVIYLTKYVSIASTSTAIMTLITVTILNLTIGPPQYDLPLVTVTTIVTILIFYRHKDNFIKILNGNENKTYLFKDKIKNKLKK
ncbi:MAG: glycerol-3-phosphate 1-O-acyltransferase PlsY [Candidatus Izimaplasma sp.]|nr:glycerol-3-phosphate 1-O-acyltransferase PlsY [Candidatus Izimaplasma bacterium]